MKRKLRSLLACIIGLTMLMTLSVSTPERVAAASSVDDAVYMIQSAQDTNYVMAVHRYPNGKEGLNVDLYKKIGAVTQLFAIQYVKSINGVRYYRIMNPYTLKVFDVEKASGSDGANCIQYEWTGDHNQLWCFEDAGWGNYKIKSMVGTYLDNADWNLCNHNNIQMWSANDGGKNQQWKLQKMGSVKLASMLYNEFHERGTAENGNNNVKYNEWFYGTDSAAREKYGPWCAVFQSWCADKSKLGDSSFFFGATASGIAKKYYWATMFGFHWANSVFTGKYSPKVGDLVFINNKQDGQLDSICHVAFVCNIDENGNVWTIDGNARDSKDGIFKVMMTKRHVDDQNICCYVSIDY